MGEKNYFRRREGGFHFSVLVFLLDNIKLKQNHNNNNKEKLNEKIVRKLSEVRGDFYFQFFVFPLDAN